MSDNRLQVKLFALRDLLRRARLHQHLAIGWGAATVLGLLVAWWRVRAGRELAPMTWLLPVVAGVALALIVFLRHKKGLVGVRELIRKLEPAQPEVRHLLSAAAEQSPAEGSGALQFLQLRVIEEALAHPWETIWRARLKRRLALARLSHAGALFALAATVVVLSRGGSGHGTGSFFLSGEEIAVTPGDIEVERGTGLVIAARFGRTPPAEATLVLDSASGAQSRLPMSRRLADPVFGAAISEVTEPGVYHIEYGTEKTRAYKITVFEFPSLVRADAELRYPAYTGLTNRTVRDTLHVSAVQGSRLTYTLHLNKPVRLARLSGKERAVSLTTATNAVAVLLDFPILETARYSLSLLDAQGRSNKFPTEVVFQALTNQTPDVKLIFPKGDPRVSRLQELQLQAEASDDFGLLKYGLGFSVAGQEPKFVELGKNAPAHSKQQFEYLLSLEKLGVDVDQAVTYFAWADDYGPDGKSRRTFSDMFFAEVRPFEEIFRPDNAGADSEGQPGSQGGGNERVRLAELQKQIVVATWNLHREKAAVEAALHP